MLEKVFSFFFFENDQIITASSDAEIYCTYVTMKKLSLLMALEKREVMSANTAALQIVSSGKSLIYSKRSVGPKMEP